MEPLSDDLAYGHALLQFPGATAHSLVKAVEIRKCDENVAATLSRPLIREVRRPDDSLPGGKRLAPGVDSGDATILGTVVTPPHTARAHDTSGGVPGS